LIPIVCLALGGEPAAPAGTERPERPVATVARTATPPVIDGRLEDPVWARAPSIGPLVQEEPEEGVAPSESTDVRLLFDADHLYIGVRCFDREPQKILASQMGRDADLSSDDRIRIVIDTFHDRRNAYWFEMNPIGHKGDALETSDGQEKNLAWDGIWEGKASIDDQGWVAEMALPFMTLNFKPGLDTWGFNISRTIRRRKESDRWATPRQDVDFDQISEAGEIRGLVGLQQGVGLDVRPFYVGRWTNDRSSVPPERDLKGQPGLDAFYKVTPNLNATLTVNTDFAEAEVDERQINLTRFKLTFPELRDFFLQDAGTFQFADLGKDLIPFFSRRIGLSSGGDRVPIVVGGKLTGRQGGYNIGVLSVRTDAFGSTSGRDLLATRVTRNVGEQSTIGGLFTRGKPDGSGQNECYGLDANYRTSSFHGRKNMTASAWGLASHNPGERLGDDHLAYGASVGYPNDRWSWDATFKEIQKRFDPELGFVKRQDIRQYTLALGFEPRLHNRIRKLLFALEPELITGVDNGLQTADAVVEPFGFELESGDQVDLTVEPTFERLSEPFEIRTGFVVPVGDHGFTRYRIALSSADKRRVSGTLELAAGEFWTGHEADFLAGASWRPGRHFNGSIDYEENRIVLPAGHFAARLTRVHANFQYSPDLTWSSFVQFDNESNELGYNSRIRWIPRPGNELFLVFNESLLRSGSTLSPQFQEAPVKLEYTIRF
jgi:hypothetical protein